MEDHAQYKKWWILLIALLFGSVLPLGDKATTYTGSDFILGILFVYSYHRSCYALLQWCVSRLNETNWVRQIIILITYSVGVFLVLLSIVEIQGKLDLHKQKVFLSFLFFTVITGTHLVLLVNAYYQQILLKELNQKKIILDEKYKVLKSKGILHFLQNALQATQKLIALDPQKALTQIDTLTRLLRSLLQSRDKEFILLKEEGELMREFVALLALQGNVRIDFELESDPHYDRYKIPPFILILIFDSIFINRSFIPYAQLQVYVENGIYLVAKYQTLRKDGEENAHQELLHNLKQRYAFIQQDADVAIIKTTSHTFVKVPLLEPSQTNEYNGFRLERN